MRFGLREKLLVPTVFAFALGTAVAVYFMYKHTSQAIEDTIRQSLELETHRTVQQMDLRIQARKLEAESWGNREETVAALEDRSYFGRNARKVAAAELAKLRRDYDFYDFIAIVDRDGSIVASSSKIPESKRHFANRKFLREALAGITTVTPVFESTLSGKKVFVVAAPVRNAQTIIGAIIGSIHVDSFREHFLDSFMPTEGGFAYLAAPDGAILSVSNRQKLSFDDLNSVEFGKTILAQAEGSVRHELNGETWLSSFARSHENGMIYVAAECAESAAVHAYRTVRFALLVSVITVIAVTIVAARIFRRKISSRLDDMLQVFERAESGELDVAIRDDEAGEDEISKLIKGFNSMLGKLRASQSDLYDEFKERQNANERRKALIAELEIKNSELERFTYTVSHDLKSPLITIKGFLGVMRQDLLKFDLDRCEQDIQRVEQAADKMVQLLEDLLQLSRIGRLVNEPATGSFRSLAKEAVALLESQVREGGVEIVYPDEDVEVFGDLPRLREMLQNLVDNAIKYMGDQANPTVTIGFAREDGETVFSVVDNGIGIQEQYHDKVFDLFDQLDPSAPGSGVGLAIVKRIIELHGGRVWIRSSDFDQGTHICFTIASRPQKG